MSGSLKFARSGAATLGPGQAGVGMLEFLLALMIFSAGLIGLLAAQLAGLKASHEASQRTVATVLASDILERIQANPVNADAYVYPRQGEVGQRLPAPAADCGLVACSGLQLAAFDLWQWESLLLGSSEDEPGRRAGQLRFPGACITHNEGVVGIVVSWQGASSTQRFPFLECAEDTSEAEQVQPDARVPGRLHVSLLTYVAAG